MSDQLPPPVGEPVPVDPPSGTLLPSSGSPDAVEPPAAPSYAAEPPVFGAPELLAGGTVLPPAEPTRQRVRGRTVIAAALGVLLVLVAGGAAYGWSFLNRADVKLARAFDATRSAPGSLTVTVDGTGEASPKLRYAWTAEGTVQLQVSPAGGGVALDIISSTNRLVLRVDPSAVPESAAAVEQLRTIAATLGADGAPLSALADGKPIGMSIGPGSRFQMLIDEAGATSASQSPDSAAVQQQIATLADAIASSVKDNVTVESAGSDQYGDRSTITLPLKPVVAQAMQSLKQSIPALGDAASGVDLAELDAKTLHADVWVADGRISRIAVPFAQLGSSEKGTLVIVVGTDGVQQPAQQVTEVSDALLDKLLGGLPALGTGAGG